jgi:hypothetical protein
METKEVTISKNLITKHFSFLETEGYEINIEEEASQFFLENLNIIYTSEIKKRKITVSFTKSNFDNEIRFSYTTSIVRLPYNSAYEDFFSLAAYCNAKGNEFNTTIINEFDEQEATAIIRRISEFIQKNASKFVHGIEWEEGFYPKWN